MKKLRLSVAALALLALGILAGCSQTSAKSPEVSDNIRKSLDQAGLKDVSVNQDRDKESTLGERSQKRLSQQNPAKSLALASRRKSDCVVPVGIEKMQRP